MKQFYFTFKDEVFRVSSDKALSAMGIANKAFSLPAGDVVEDENGVRHVVASFGFEEIA